MLSLGKDFWFIIEIIKIILRILEELGKKGNGDTPEGQL